MTYTHKMLPLPQTYDQATVEKKWQKHWLAARTYAWNPETPRADSYVIDTPPPTVSGTLHMGHVFSYTQADFIARFQRMTGKNVFYPMGFDDNGLPTERLVEKTKKIRAVDMSREKFIEECLGVSEEARKEFRALFESIALSVDWDQEYHTISDDSRRLSQLSFLDLVQNEHCYRAQRPFYWDPVDQTAIASAEIEDKELPSFANEIVFKVKTPSPAAPKSASTSPQGRGFPAASLCSDGEAGAPLPRGEVEKPSAGFSGEGDLIIMTTRPELLPACVALFCHPDDTRYLDLHGKEAIVPLFGFPVPILTDVTVDMDKGTGLMMCCTFGDDADILKWQKHSLPTRVVVNKFGKMDFSNLPEAVPYIQAVTPGSSRGPAEQPTPSTVLTDGRIPAQGRDDSPWMLLQGKKVSNADSKHPGARQMIIELLKEAGLLISSKPITHTVKCAERSGAPLEILPTAQWFVKVTDKKEALKRRAAESNWNPDWMRLRIEQWIDGLNQDWCISRQRYFGVPFPVWYEVEAIGSLSEYKKASATIVYPKSDELPVNPLANLPAGYKRHEPISPLETTLADWVTCVRPDGKIVWLRGDPDVMDTWATSSISPQLSAHAITADTATDKDRFSKLFPADLRPQAHEIIRTWAFYTIVKAHLHTNSVPWHNLMISGWCLAEDKSKMSKSKGNVITPVALIEERGTDAVRYWAGTSRLGADTAFSPDLLKIGKKLVGKLWNATAFAPIHLAKMTEQPTNPSVDSAITETLDRWILSRLGETVAIATDAFRSYEYADALDATNQFFWADFCDNYLELIKKRVYNEDGSATQAAQQSAVRTLYYVLDGILKLYAPFTPHVTEELYSHIFADAYAAKGSLHAQGQWPKAEDYLNDDVALSAGGIVMSALEQVRRAKSEANKSIKYPVEYLVVSPGEIPVTALDSVAADLKGAGNIRTLTWDVGEKHFQITLATEADAA